MDQFTREKLHLTSRSSAELQNVLDSFESKWQGKVRRAVEAEDDMPLQHY